MTFLPHRASRGVRHTGDPTTRASLVYQGDPQATLFPEWPRPVATAAQPHPNALAPHTTRPMQRAVSLTLGGKAALPHHTAIGHDPKILKISWAIEKSNTLAASFACFSFSASTSFDSRVNLS